MKRLVSVTKQTEKFNIDTQSELKLIELKDKRLTTDKLIIYSKNNNEGIMGGIYYELENEKIRLLLLGLMHKDKY